MDAILARQSSGMIRARPSHDDDDDFDEHPLFETSNSDENLVSMGEKSKNLSVSDNSNDSIDSNSSNDISTESSVERNGGLVSGEEEIGKTGIDPGEERVEKMVGSAQNEVSGNGSVVGFGVRAGVPVAKVSHEGDDDDDDDDDDDENEVGSVEEDGEDEVERSYASVVEGGIPKVRVLSEEDEEEEWGESVEGPDIETAGGGEGVEEEKRVEGSEVGSGRVEENAVLNSGVVDSRGVELVEEGDSVVDSIDVDVVEAVRSGMAVVGVDGKQESGVGVGEESVVEEEFVEANSTTFEGEGVKSTDEGGSVENSANVDAVESDANVMERKDAEVEVGNEETSAVEESAPADSVAAETVGVKYTNEGDAIVDSINVDAVEAVRSGAAVVGEVGETKGSGVELESSVVENAAPVVEDSVAEESAPQDAKATDTEGMNISGQSDSVVDGIHLDVVEAIRSGAALVGDSKVEDLETEVKERGASVGENVTLANDFAPLVATNSSEILDVSGKQLLESQVNEAEAPQSVESAEPLSTEDKPFISKQHEPAGELQSVSGGEIENAQPEPEAHSAVVEGESKSDRSYASVLVNGLDDAASDENHQHETLEKTKVPTPETGVETEDQKPIPLEEGGDDGSGSDGEDLTLFGSESASRNIIEEFESRDRSDMIDGQVVTDSEEEGDSDEEGDGKELFDSAALAALLKAASTASAGSDPGHFTITSQDGSRLFSVERPAGLGPSLRSVRPASGTNNSSFFTPSNFAPPSEEDLSDEEKKKLENIQQLKVKFLRLVQRVGFTAEHSLAAQILYKLTVFSGRPTSPAFSLDNAKQTAAELEAEGKDDLNFALNILVLGKTGVGKSATINSIFGEEKVKINAFEPETSSVNEICGVVDGVKIRVIDAPGLKASAMEQGFNRKILASVKNFTKKHPPDVVFYVDRLDSQTRDLNDLPVLRTITSSLGSSIWRNAIITLTHASSAPPDGPSGTPLSYEVFVSQRGHIVQQSIGQALGDMRLMNLNMMNPVTLVENHPACRKNREGQRVLPNGQAWKPQLLLLCYSVKILSEATATSKPQDPFDTRKLFGFRTRAPPLQYFLSSLLQPRAHPKLSADQGGDSVDSDIDLDDLSDSDQEEEEDEYDQLPPFKPLRKAQMAKLSREQRKAYFEEYDYRVKLLQRKQWREELKRIREMKKNGKSGMDDYGEMAEDYDGENGAPAAVPVPLPDMVLPPSFDSDNPAYRYRFLEPTSQFLARPVLDSHGWDHDCGYDGVNVEQNLGIAGCFPAALAVQVTKDKKDLNVHLDSAVSAKHGESGSSLVGFDVQTLGKQYAYVIRGESKFKNLKKNKTSAGVSVTFLGENVATGVKVEDQIILNKRLVLVGSTGTVRSQKDAAYGANLEVRLREADYPIGQEQSSLTLSLMKWRGDLGVGANLQSQVSLGRNSKMAVRVSLNNKMSGQVTVRTSSSDHLSLALAGLMPIAVAIYKRLRPGVVSDNYSIY